MTSSKLVSSAHREDISRHTLPPFQRHFQSHYLCSPALISRIQDHVTVPISTTAQVITRIGGCSDDQRGVRQH